MIAYAVPPLWHLCFAFDLQKYISQKKLFARVVISIPVRSGETMLLRSHLNFVNARLGSRGEIDGVF